MDIARKFLVHKLLVHFQEIPSMNSVPFPKSMISLTLNRLHSSQNLLSILVYTLYSIYELHEICSKPRHSVVVIDLQPPRCLLIMVRSQLLLPICVINIFRAMKMQCWNSDEIWGTRQTQRRCVTVSKVSCPTNFNIASVESELTTRQIRHHRRKRPHTQHPKLKLNLALLSRKAHLPPLLLMQ